MDEIRLDTFRALSKHHYELACSCPGCRRWASCGLRQQALISRQSSGSNGPRGLRRRAVGING